ncbi:MAG: acriflavin resistance protein [Spirochaetaceae bacterium 4572_7]|nr:MAG: acriflavin resistance protein [Spirochaetaceae bacterium 4572_7]
MFLSNLSIKQPVMISMVMAALLLFGIIAYRDIPLNSMPDAKIPYITITTTYVGAAPEQVEKMITEKIENEISSISQLKTIQSYSLNSASIMMLEFELSKDPDIANQEVKEKVDIILNSLPDGADEPIVQKIDITASSVVELMLSGDIESTELYSIADNSIKDLLAQINGVGSVSLTGGSRKEIRVEFDKGTIYENNISLTQLSSILASANMDMPGGNFQNKGQDYSVTLKGELSTTDELGEMMVPTSTGMRKLGQLATINPIAADVKKKVTLFNTKNGLRQDNTVLLSIVKSSDGNPVTIAKEVKELLPKIKAMLPESVNLTITADTSNFIEDTVNDTISNILLGILFTAAILLFFLHDFRSTLIVALTMPLSIIPTFIIMNKVGITLNIMSLMGLSTVVGTLVMNSVVVLENIFRHKSLGHSTKVAAGKGTSEVAIAVIASALTNVAVFVPLGTMDGIAGIFIGDFALTVVIATLFSLVISFTLTPMLASLILPDGEKQKNKISIKIEGMFISLEKGYSFLLEKILHNRKRSFLVIAITLVFFVVSMVAFTKVPFEFTPAMDGGTISIEVELPADASLEHTAILVKEVENRVSAYEEVKQIVTTLGSISALNSGTNLALVNIDLIDKDYRESNSIIANKIGASLSNLPGAVFRIIPSTGSMGGASSPISFYLQGNNLEELQNYTNLLKDEMYNIKGLMQQLAMGMRSAVDGTVMTQLKTKDGEYDIRVTLKDSDVSSYENIRNIPIATTRGIYPVSYFAEVEVEEGISKLLRINKKSSVNIAAAVKILPQDVTLRWGGDAEMMTDTMKNMAFAFIIAIVLTYMLLAAILGKLGQPILILSTVPLSLIGVVILFRIGGFSMNMVSMMAIIMLVGMVVNNAILILEYTNQLRRDGMGVRAALLKACPTKLQPILMANIATILGMLPMAMGIGKSGAEMRQPMGLVSIGGLFTATFLTLFVIPAIENLVESKKDEKKLRKEKDVKIEMTEKELVTV